MVAVANHHLENVSWLVSIDVDSMKTQNTNKQSQLHHSAANNNTEIASVLLKALKSSDSFSLFSSADNSGVTTSSWSWSKGHLGFRKWLLEEYKTSMSEYDPLLHTIQDNDGDTPLMLAEANHHLEIVSWLVSIDADCMKTQKTKHKQIK